jgi:GNAT superfamily N-acetyltransferase
MLGGNAEASMTELIDILESRISGDQHRQISAIRNASFPEFRTDRSYHKQLPHFRILALDKGWIQGHMGIDHRIICVGEEPISIFGVIDLCVDPAHRGNGIGKSLLVRAIQLARDANIDFMFLIADDHRLYGECGFSAIDATCAWLRIDEHKNYGLSVEEIKGEIMVKSVNGKAWPNGAVDLLGYLF